MSTNTTSITYEQVAVAAESLQRSSVKVSTLTVREKLGRGSFSTIKKHLDQWRMAGGPEAPSAPVEVPPQLESLWQAAQHAAEEQLSAERQALEATAIELDSKLARMEQTLLDAERARQQAEARLQDKDAELVRLMRLLELANARADHANEDLKIALQAQAQTLFESLNRIEGRLEPLDAALELDREQRAQQIGRIQEQIAQFTESLQCLAEPMPSLVRDVEGLSRQLTDGLQALGSDAATAFSTERTELLNALSAPLTRLTSTTEELSRQSLLDRRARARSRHRKRPR